ncbi:hypothetical protein FB451DRAFT_1276940 [Mycena latifolia]|nr:hypothetical protein FB451DRAFT_1276940 [Mycena latifolia]
MPLSGLYMVSTSLTRFCDLSVGFMDDLSQRDKNSELYYFRPGNQPHEETGHLTLIESGTSVLSKFGVWGRSGTSKAGVHLISTKSDGRIKSYDTCSGGRSAPITVFLFCHNRPRSISTNSPSFGDFLGSFYSRNSGHQSMTAFCLHSCHVLSI